MMYKNRQLIAVIIIIIIIIILDIIFENITNKNLDNIYDELSKLDEEIELVENIEDENISDIQKIEIENGDIEKVNSFSNKIEDTWEKYQKFLAYYIEHDEIEKIGDKLNVIQKQTKIQDYRRCKTSNFWSSIFD